MREKERKRERERERERERVCGVVWCDLCGKLMSKTQILHIAQSLPYAMSQGTRQATHQAHSQPGVP